MLLNQWDIPILPLNQKCDVLINLHIEIGGSEEIMPNRVNFLKDNEPTLAEALNKYSKGDFDMKISCDDEEFPCHKSILSSRSDVFKTMFSTPDSKEGKDAIIEIPDISAQTMKSFLKFLYYDDLEEDEIDCNLLIAADKYNFKRLFNISLKQIERTIDVINVMVVTVAAHLIENNQLLEKASNFIFEKRGSIRKCELWHQIRKKNPEIAAKVMDLIVFHEPKKSRRVSTRGPTISN